MHDRKEGWAKWAVASAAVVLPAAHPLLLGAIGAPSHLLWFALPLSAAIVTYAWGFRGAIPAVLGAVVWVGVGERAFGGGYGTSADEATMVALMTAVGLISALIAGFALAVRAEQERTRAAHLQLAQGQKMEAIGRLAGGVAHDFNNLLTVIVSTAHVLRDDTKPGTQAHEDIEAIIGAANSATDLTRQLLTFSRRKDHVKRVLDINATVRGMEGMVRRLVGADVAFNFKLDAAAGHVETDSGQLEQIVMNLVANSRDAMPSGGQITIATGALRITADDAARKAAEGLKAGTYAVLEVTDTGEGMDDATRARMFEPFFTTKGPGKGTGLGLATVFGIVRDAGGDVLVSSRPGKGTCIRACFRQAVAPADPARATANARRVDTAASVATTADEATTANEAAAAAGATRASNATPAASVDAGATATGARKVALLVEDEPTVRAVTRRMLEQLGYRVTVAEDGDAAIRAFDRDPAGVDVVISDIVMPGKSGLVVAQHVCMRSPNTPVLFVSGHTTDHAGLRAALERGHQFIQKPYDLATLAAAIGTTRSACAVSPARP